ncbi:MAG TPA: DHH family phosphoesterase, partial [candidate division Zixibacteria bacterium]|nr:DHH family phosphoesterase [candidate division Zixibacteria bacterium]
MTQEPTQTFAAIRATLAGARRALITSHRDCDGDSVGGQLAALAFADSLGVASLACHHGPVPDTLRGAPGWERIIDISSDDARVAGLTADFDVALVLECSDLDRLGEVRRLVGPATTLINIDHHADNTGFGSVVWQDPTASSVCEML